MDYHNVDWRFYHSTYGSRALLDSIDYADMSDMSVAK